MAVSGFDFLLQGLTPHHIHCLLIAWIGCPHLDSDVAELYALISKHRKATSYLSRLRTEGAGQLT